MPSPSRLHLCLKRLCFIIVGVWLLVAAAVAGCSNRLPEQPIASESVSDSEPKGAAFTFGIIYPIAHPFYENITASAEQSAANAGVQLIIKAPDEASVEQQIRILESMIRLQLDGIAISPIDSKALAPYIDQAVSAGIPVVCFESDAPSSSRLSYIGGDNTRAGDRMGKALAQLLRNGGMVIVEAGIPGISSHRERLNGFLDYIEEDTQIQVLDIKYHDGNDARALTELEQMIDAHPHFDAFIALDFISGSNSIIAWKAMGLSRYALTLGMMPAIEEAIINQQITLAITQREDSWGPRIVHTLLQAMKEESVAEIIDTGEAIISENHYK